MFVPAQFEIRSELNQDAARMTVSGELDLATVPRLRHEAESLLKQGASRIVIDLNDLTFIDSSGLSLLIELNNRSASEGWALQLTRPPAKTYSVFSITGADANLPFLESPGSQ